MELKLFLSDNNYTPKTQALMINYKKLFQDFFPQINQKEKQILYNNECLDKTKERTLTTQAGFFAGQRRMVTNNNVISSPYQLRPGKKAGSISARSIETASNVDSLYFQKSLSKEQQQLKSLVEAHWK